MVLKECFTSNEQALKPMLEALFFSERFSPLPPKTKTQTPHTPEYTGG